jgi:hypothetical protein
MAFMWLFVSRKKAYKVKRGLGLLRRPLDSHKQTFSGGHVPRCHREEQIKQLKKKKKVAAKAKRDKKKLASKIRKPYEAEKQNFLKQIKQLEEELESAACCQECGHLRLQLACERDTFVLHLQKCSTSLKELTLNEQCPTADRENDSQTSTGVGYDSTVPSSPRTQYGPLDENSDPGNIGTQVRVIFLSLYVDPFGAS